MPYIETESLQPHMLTAEVQHQVYCGLDTCVTFEVHNELQRLFNQEPPVYSFERALQGPYLEIMQRGFKVDTLSREMASRELRERIAQLNEVLQEYAHAVWNKGLNPRSPAQLKSFFYSAMKLPEIWISQKGERKLSTNRETLEKLDERYLYSRPIVACILAIRDLAKQLEVFETEIDSDSRYRTSYNIAGTETGRPSSSSNAFGTGGNAQNINQWLRYVFVADPGWKLCVIDLEQVEARDVGWFEGCLFNDWSFLDACEGGDLHTTNCRLIWPELAWTGEPKRDRALADRQFYREFSYRDMSKRGGHLCLTQDHEVLTPEGWKYISSKPKTIMAFNINGTSYFEEVTNWVDEEYSGNLHQFEGNSISALMTAEHKVPVLADQRHGKIKGREAKYGPGTFMPLGQGWVGGSENTPARLLAAFMSDGSYGSKNTIKFHMKKERKFQRLAHLCSVYGFEYKRNGDRATVFITDADFLPKRCGAFMFKWTRQCLEDFVDEYKYWDGHISATAVALFSVDREHMEWIQTFGRILGIGGQIKTSQVRSTFSGTSKEYTTEYYNLGQNKRLYATGKSINHSIFNTKIGVFCPTVASGFFYVRRNGKIFVTGNSNYMGTAWTMARSLKIPGKVADEFQQRYCKGPTCAYPAHQRYWGWIAEQLQTTNRLTTPFGRERHFFGRPGDDTTLREAIAFLPQSTTADRMNLGLWRVWRHMPSIQLLAQTYDSITFQFRDVPGEAERVIPEALQRIRVELEHPSGRKYVVPGEAKIGWNWGPAVTEKMIAEANEVRQDRGGKKPPRLNLEGLAKWKPGQPDTRQRQNGFSRVML